MSRRPDIAVCIPSIPTRTVLLERAMRSVKAQTLPASQIAVVVDEHKAGAAVTRQRALDAVDPAAEWVAFLDDDDEFLPEHLAKLHGYARMTGADYVYSWYNVVDMEGVLRPGWDPRPAEFGQLWTATADTPPEQIPQTTIVTLVRAELAREAGFLYPETTTEALHRPGRMFGGEDWLFTRRCVALGAKVSHLPERTWLWYHHGRNTSGLPTRW